MKLWVHALLWLPVVGVAAVSCGDDAKKVVSNAAGGEGGSAMQPSSGGSDVVVPSEGGSGGAPVVPGGGNPPEAGMGPMAVAGQGGFSDAGGAGGNPGLVCAPVIASGGAGGDPYGGGQWLDVAAGECKDCPGTPLSCQDLLAAPGPSYDHDTGVLSFHISPGLSQVVAANFAFSFSSPGASDNAVLPAAVEGNDVTVELSGTVPDDLYYVWGELEVTEDGCGDQYSTGDANSFDLFLEQTGNDGGAGPVEFSVTCNND